MKNTLLLVACVGSLLLTSRALAVAPQVGFIAPGPGVNAPFDDDTATVDYGYRLDFTDNWVCDGDACWAPDPNVASVNAAIRYNASALGDNTNAGPQGKMDVTEDWVLELVWKHEGVFGGEQPIFMKNTVAADSRIAMITHTGVSDTDDTWTLWTGDANLFGGWDSVAQFSIGTDWNTFVIHYKAVSQTMDAYQNGTKFASDFQPGHGDYAASSFNLEWARLPGTKTFFRSAKLGQLVPEPGSLTLFALGLVGCGCWRKRRTS